MTGNIFLSQDGMPVAVTPTCALNPSDGDTVKRPQSARLALRAMALAATLSTALAGGLAGAASAQVQTIERSEALSVSADGVGGFGAHFGDGFTAAHGGSAFADVFTFAVEGTPFDASASVTPAFLDSPGTRDLLITGLSLYRYDPATLAVIGNAIAGIDLTGFGDNPTDSWAVTAYNLASGTYAVRVDGRVVGDAGGSFGADLAVSPVPEPQTAAMLLAGLAAGTLAWRRAAAAPGRAPARRTR